MMFADESPKLFVSVLILPNIMMLLWGHSCIFRPIRLGICFGPGVPLLDSKNAGLPSFNLGKLFDKILAICAAISGLRIAVLQLALGGDGALERCLLRH